ncbi:hypothetical protein MTBBW1_410039 [Desulfamplus magnetovallimortis]|uniref:Uncharacterized protein n=1 Tax=Desulfamplus magnetovallimortis TaxID=1246637 RepID=A0A1W1HGT3_9BACT|nr:hypothetical protein MTBBW1_410039 [Desulfamplus magnetovallimortis]
MRICIKTCPLTAMDKQAVFDEVCFGNNLKCKGINCLIVGSYALVQVMKKGLGESVCELMLNMSLKNSILLLMH